MLASIFAAEASTSVQCDREPEDDRNPAPKYKEVGIQAAHQHVICKHKLLTTNTRKASKYFLSVLIIIMVK